MRYTATIEFLTGQHAAIVTLFDDHGEWCGSERIGGIPGRHQDLYESGYNVASRKAVCRGGVLDAYRVAPV